MANVYSSRLYVAHNVTLDTLTVEAGLVVVIQTVTVFAPGPVAGGVAQLVDAESDATFWWTKITPDAAGVYVNETDCRLVIPEGKTIVISADAGFGAGVDWTLNGYALTLP